VFVAAVVEHLSAGKPFDASAQEGVTKQLVVWEEAWVTNSSNSAAAFGGTVSQGSTTAIAAELCAKYKVCSSSADLK